MESKEGTQASEDLKEVPLDHKSHLDQYWWGQEEPDKTISVTLLPSNPSPIA